MKYRVEIDIRLCKEFLWTKKYKNFDHFFDFNSEEKARNFIESYTDSGNLVSYHDELNKFVVKIPNNWYISLFDVSTLEVDDED